MSNFQKSINCLDRLVPDQNYFFVGDKLIAEKVETKGLLKFFYGNACGKCCRYIFNKRWFSKLAGYYFDTRFSKRSIRSFIKKHSIDMTQFEKSQKEFTSFNDFFIRKLKPGARSIDMSQDVLVSPCDAKLLVLPNLQQNTEFFIKGNYFNLNKFFKNEQLAKKFEGGTMLVFRLAPYDYHRFHFPTDCVPSAVIKIKGKYDSVNPYVFKSGYQPLAENERHLIMLKTKVFGEVVMMPVGAMCVGKIVETYMASFLKNQKYKKGEEVGYFSFGGSTVVLVFQKDKIFVDQKFIKHSRPRGGGDPGNCIPSKLGYETQVLFGQRIGEKIGCLILKKEMR